MRRLFRQTVQPARRSRQSAPIPGVMLREPSLANSAANTRPSLRYSVGSGLAPKCRFHPHMMRHGCGYALANAGHDTRALQAWLGHRNIQHTVRYTELAPDRFKNFWRD